MENITFVDTLVKGFNNPDCAFYVGQMAGQFSTWFLISRIAMIYFAFKLLDKIVFTGIPHLFKKLKEKKE